MMRRLGPWRLVGMSLPMGVWALHFVLVYSLVGLACAEGWPATRLAGVRLLTWALLASTAVTLALIGWLGWRAWRARQSLPADDSPAAAAGTVPRQRFTSLATSVLALIAFIAVMFTGAPMFMLSTCI